jgi:hypothetical protein
VRAKFAPLCTSATLGTVVLLVAACGSPKSVSNAPAAASPAAIAVGTSPAAVLRAKLTALFTAHAALTADATAAAVAGRTAETQSAADALDKNSVAIAQVVGSAYGSDVETSFLAGWRQHIGYFVDYTQADVTHDAALKQKALDELNTYSTQAAQFFNSANGMPLAATLAMFNEHVTELTTMIDAQTAGDQVTAYAQLSAALQHMPMMAEAITTATARKFPRQFAVTP